MADLVYGTTAYTMNDSTARKAQAVIHALLEAGLSFFEVEANHGSTGKVVLLFTPGVPVQFVYGDSESSDLTEDETQEISGLLSAFKQSHYVPLLG